MQDEQQNTMKGQQQKDLEEQQKTIEVSSIRV
jgi:hypothetical protein